MKKVRFIYLFVFLMFVSSCTVLNKTNNYADVNKYHFLPIDGEYYDDSVKTIDINWLKGDINIISTDEYQNITLFERTNDSYSEKYLTHVMHDDKLLKIQYGKSGVSFPNRYLKSLSIFIPKNMLLEQLIINCASCNVTISNVSFESINIKNQSGKYTISETYAERFIYQGMSGNLTYTPGNETQYIAINQQSGNTFLSIPNNTLGIGLFYESSSGSLNSSLELTKENNKYVYLDEKYTVINYKSQSGSLTLTTYECELEPVERKNDEIDDSSEDISEIEQSDKTSEETSSITSEIESEETSLEYSEQISESEVYSIDFSLEVISDSGSWGPLQ